jgi:hypothetical protein
MNQIILDLNNLIDILNRKINNNVSFNQNPSRNVSTTTPAPR